MRRTSSCHCRSVPRTVGVILTLAAVLLGGRHVEASTLVSGPMQEYLFTEGKKYFDEGKTVQAIEIWSNILPDGLYSPVAYVLSTRGYLDLGRAQSAEDILKEFLKKFPKSPYRTMVQEALVDVMCRSSKPGAADMLASLVAQASTEKKADLILRWARLERGLKNYSKAAELYGRLFIRYPATVEGLAAADELAWMVFHGKVERPAFSDKEHLARATRLYRNGRFDLAAYSYELLLKKDPRDVGLKLKLGRALYKDRRNLRAIEVLKELIREPAAGNIRMEALHTLSLVYWRLDRVKAFEACCRELIENGPNSLKRKAQFNLAANNFEHKQWDLAEANFARVLKMAPGRAMQAQVRWKLAWITYLRKDYRRAAELFREAGRSSPGGKLRDASRYWEAKSLILSGNPKEARRILQGIARSSPLEYYGMAAARQLKSMGLSPELNQESRKPFPEVALTSAQRADSRVEAALKLMELGLHEFAFLNLQALPSSMKDDTPIVFLAARAAHGAGRYREAQQILASRFGHLMRNPPPDAPKDFIEIALPRVHFHETVQYAEKHSLDPHLVWAVMRQESLYDESAVSPAGALGLMQVTPRASGLTRKKGKIPSKVIAEILEPKKNIAFGIRILASNVRTFKGNLVPAIASYNADIRKVRQWVQRNGTMEPDEFIENIPYAETRHYVKKVLAGYQAYTYLHRKKDLAGYW